MFHFSKLQLDVIQDEIFEKIQNLRMFIGNHLPRKHNRVGVRVGRFSSDGSLGRIWVEIPGGLKLCVIHLHPSNPAVAEEVSSRISANEKDTFCIKPPDEISVSSLEDYWFNHWQGPYISSDSNQNNFDLDQSGHSLRKSVQKFRCSICHKKIEAADNSGSNLTEPQHHEAVENIRAHTSSVRSDKSPARKDELLVPEEFNIKPGNNEETHSVKYGGSDEHLSRAARVVDHELRTSFTLFAQDVPTQDVVDAVSMDLDDDLSPLTSDRLYPSSPRQSRSCPCSPKFSHRNSSPRATLNSPKSRLFGNSSKFSLSSSLLAIHRTASNTLKQDNLKNDTQSSNSKCSLLQDSLKTEARHSHRFMSEPKSSDLIFKSDGESPHSKILIQESHSLPALKFSRASSGSKVSEVCHDEEMYDLFELDAEVEESTNKSTGTSSLVEPCCRSLSSSPRISKTYPFLPDVVPIQEGVNEAQNDQVESDCALGSKTGIINLAFDGHEESSDYAVCESEQYDDSQCTEQSINIGKNSVGLGVHHAHAVSIGHSSNGKETITIEVHDLRAVANEIPASVGSAELPLTSNLPYAVSKPEIILSSPHATQTPTGLTEPDLEEDTGKNNTIDIIMPPADVDPMQETRSLIYWWQKLVSPPSDNTEFCIHYNDRKVKKKPLLLFLHSIGGSADLWIQQLWYFVMCGYEVVAPDLIGHGLSSAPDERSHYTFTRIIDHLNLIFDLFVPQGRKCIIIGHGYGCVLGAALARMRLLSVPLLVLASSGGPSPLVNYPPGTKPFRMQMSEFVEPFLSCGCGRDWLYMPRGKHFSVQSLTGRNVTPTPRYVIEHMAHGEKWAEGDIGFHRRILIPTLLLYGIKDKIISLVDMCEMERTIPRAFLELLPGAGHVLMTDSPEEVCHSIHRFMTRWKHHL